MTCHGTAVGIADSIGESAATNAYRLFDQPLAVCRLRNTNTKMHRKQQTLLNTNSPNNYLETILAVDVIRTYDTLLRIEIQMPFAGSVRKVCTLMIQSVDAFTRALVPSAGSVTQALQAVGVRIAVIRLVGLKELNTEYLKHRPGLFKDFNQLFQELR